jgi:integrase
MDWIKDEKLTGLYKRVRTSGDVWAIKARIKGGKPITYTLGKVELMKPSQARQKAKLILAQLAEGINPNHTIKTRREIEKARGLTLGKAIQEYSALASWKEQTRHEALATLNRRFGDWYRRPLSSITKEECQARFIKIKSDVKSLKLKRDSKRIDNQLPVKEPRNEVGLAEAQRAFRYLSAVFSSYVHDDAGNEKLLPKGNPCLILKAKKLRKLLIPKERFLDDRERDSLYEALRIASHWQYEGNLQTDDSDLAWILIHTGLRLEECLGMKWADVDFKKEVFKVKNTKNHKDHILPMTEATKDVLTRRYEEKISEKYVFPSPLSANKPVTEHKPMTASRTFDRLSEEIGFEFTAHDLRRTVATVASDLGYDLNAIGQLLNHSKNGVTSGYIQKTHQRLKQILEDIQNSLFRDA